MRQSKVKVLLAALLLVCLVAPLRPVYRAVRTAGRFFPVQQPGKVLISANFKLFYDGDLVEAQAMLQLLEDSLAELQLWLPDRTPKPIVARLHPSQDALQRALGPGEYTPTLGAYYLGRLELLAPQAWYPELSLADALARYSWQGPVVHELTHLFLDYQALSAYPMWFSEGLAQYWEMRLRGYVWDEGGAAWRYHPHTLMELADNFVGLPEAVAYREALSLVQFLYSETGEKGMGNLLTMLEHGQPFASALQLVYGDGMRTLENAWRAWLLAE